MKHVKDLTTKTGSTRNYSDTTISPAIRAVFSIFKINYKSLFKAQYDQPEELNKDMRLWQHQFGYLPADRLKAAALDAVTRCEYVPKVADMQRSLNNVRVHPSHQHLPALPRPPKTEKSKQIAADALAKMTIKRG